ncbi:MAG: hypothetical protein WC314_19420 [Vulcanimicrobiota bacterium]
MQVHRRSWTINLGGPNPGKDIGRELDVSKLKKGLSETADMFKAGDNGEYRTPLPNRTDCVWVGRDLDPRPGRVLADYSDFSQGSFTAAQEGGLVRSYFTPNELKCAFEFDPATGHALSYSGENQGLCFDVTYADGRLKEVKTGSASGDYQESITFSADGKVATFNSEQKLEEGEEADENRKWFLALGK